MSNIKVLVTGRMPEAGLTELRKNFAVTRKPEKEGRAWVLAHLSEYEGLILMGTQEIGRASCRERAATSVCA